MTRVYKTEHHGQRRMRSVGTYIPFVRRNIHITIETMSPHIKVKAFTLRLLCQNLQFRQFLRSFLVLNFLSLGRPSNIQDKRMPCAFIMERLMIVMGWIVSIAAGTVETG